MSWPTGISRAPGVSPARSRPQAARLAQERPHVVVATPGRLADLVETHSEVADAFARVSALVLDEADRLLDGAAGFERPLTAICSRLPRGRQSMLFSATMPEDIARLVHEMMNQPERIEVAPQGKTADRVEQKLFFVPALLEWARGARNAFAAMMFAWTGVS